MQLPTSQHLKFQVWMTLNIKTEMYSKWRCHNPFDQYQTCTEADNYHLEMWHHAVWYKLTQVLEEHF